MEGKRGRGGRGTGRRCIMAVGGMDSPVCYAVLAVSSSSVSVLFRAC